jgi:hypothetical protein
MTTSTKTGFVYPSGESDSYKVATYNEALLNGIEPLIIGELSLSVAGSSNVTLTTAQGQNARMVFTGLLTGNIVVFIRVPTGTTAGYSAKRFSVYNNTTGSFTLTVKTTAAGSTGVEVPQGARVLLEHDGTNVSLIGVATVTGTFTPGISFGGGTTGITYAARVGWYQRLGNRVNIAAFIALSSKGSSTGAALITGLPIAASATPFLFQAVTVSFDAATYTGSAVAQVNPSATTISLLLDAGGTQSALTNANFTNSTNVKVNFGYFID